MTLLLYRHKYEASWSPVKFIYTVSEIPCAPVGSMILLERTLYVHDRPVYIVWSEVLSTVGEACKGIRVGFINRINSSQNSYFFVSGVKNLLLSSLSNIYHVIIKKNQPSLHYRTSNLLLYVTSLSTTSLTPLSYLSATVRPSWSVWKFLLLVYFWSWVEGSFMLRGCPLSATSRVSHSASLYPDLSTYH